METITCPNCSGVSAVEPSLRGSSVVCGVCAHEFQTEALHSSKPPTKRKRKESKGTILAIRTLIVLSFVGFLFLGHYGCQKMVEHDQKEREERAAFQRELDRKYGPKGGSGEQVEAWAQMQIFVKQELKNPRDANFPFGGHRSVVALGDGRFRVRSYVDATNSFGATVRTNFDGVIERRQGGWNLERLSLE